MSAMSAREKYWLKVWNDKHAFEPDPVAGKKKAFVTITGETPAIDVATQLGMM